MADSPNKDSDGVVTYTIKSEGSPVKGTVQLVSIEVHKAINKIPSATLEIVDGDMSTQDFPISNDDVFAPGSEIIITAGYASNEEQIFKGIVIRHGISLGGHKDSRLIVECKDKTVGMTVARENNNYLQQKDSDVISELLDKYEGLTADVDGTETVIDELVQFNCTDWDFMLARAEANGFVICADDNTVTVKSPQIDAAVLTVTYGEDLMEFTAEIDARYQYKSVKGIAWDIKSQSATTEIMQPVTLNQQGDISSDTLADVLKLKAFRLQTGTTLESSALKNWIKGQQVKSALAKIRGNMKFQGSAKAKIGSIIEAKGVGNRFNGDLYISAVKHIISKGQWHTEVEFGMSPDWSAEYRDLAAPPAAGLLPPVEGLQIGVVSKLDEDPLQQHRVQVILPILEAENEGVWARLSTFYASQGIGNFFIPELGDEVVLGYFNNNPNEPVILGSLYSSKNSPPYDLSAENNIKAIVTKSKLTIEFDEENKVTTISTPSGNEIVLSDKDKSIVLQDQNSNKVELSPDGISLDSPKDIKITAKGAISLEAAGDINLSSTAGDLNGKAGNVSLDAKIGFVAKGAASAEVSASGQTTVKGAMVMIN